MCHMNGLQNIMQYSMEIDKSQCYRHTTATIVMQSRIPGLIGMTSQMMIAIHMSQDRIM